MASAAKKADMEKRLFDLRLKLNAGRKANKKQVVEEHRRITEAGTSTGVASSLKRKAKTEEDEEKPQRIDDSNANTKNYLNDSSTLECMGVKFLIVIYSY